MNKEHKIKSMQQGKGVQITTSNGYRVSCVWGAGTYSDNNNLRTNDDIHKHSTTTIEIGILTDAPGCHFVCLPSDVAAYVPVSNLGPIIEAVENEDWLEVCRLCGDCDDKYPVDTSKFPAKKDKQNV